MRSYCEAYVAIVTRVQNLVHYTTTEVCKGFKFNSTTQTEAVIIILIRSLFLLGCKPFKKKIIESFKDGNLCYYGNIINYFFLHARMSEDSFHLCIT